MSAEVPRISVIDNQIQTKGTEQYVMYLKGKLWKGMVKHKKDSDLVIIKSLRFNTIIPVIITTLETSGKHNRWRILYKYLEAVMIIKCH